MKVAILSHPRVITESGVGAATKLSWLAPRNILKDKVRSAKESRTAMNQLAIMYGDRFTGIQM